MAIQVNGNTVINDSRRGMFLKLNPGAYETLPSASVGDFVYSINDQTIKVWTGSEWK